MRCSSFFTQLLLLLRASVVANELGEGCRYVVEVLAERTADVVAVGRRPVGLLNVEAIISWEKVS